MGYWSAFLLLFLIFTHLTFVFWFSIQFFFSWNFAWAGTGLKINNSNSAEAQKHWPQQCAQHALQWCAHVLRGLWTHCCVAGDVSAVCETGRAACAWRDKGGGPGNRRKRLDTDTFFRRYLHGNFMIDSKPMLRMTGRWNNTKSGWCRILSTACFLLVCIETFSPTPPI